MRKIAVHAIDDVPPFSGKHTIPGIKFRPLAQALGVSAWGMNVLDLAPNCDGHPEHDHRADGQEEMYLVLRGSAKLRCDGEEVSFVAGESVRVGPSSRRQLIAGPEGARILAIGATAEPASAG